MPHWPSSKAFTLREADLGSIPLFHCGSFSRSGHTGGLKKIGIPVGAVIGM